RSLVLEFCNDAFDKPLVHNDVAVRQDNDVMAGRWLPFDEVCDFRVLAVPAVVDDKGYLFRRVQPLHEPNEPVCGVRELLRSANDLYLSPIALSAERYEPHEQSGLTSVQRLEYRNRFR